MTKTEFIKKHCNICGYHDCKGPDTELFDGCSFKHEFDGHMCSSYHKITRTRYLSDFEQGIYFALNKSRITKIDEVVGICWGTKELEECTCGGNELECNFYPKKREMKNG